MTSQPPTVTDVERIAAMTDPILRNLEITQCYHELAVGLTARTGISANWCTFATWASKQAGQTIRREDVIRALEDLLKSLALAAQAAPDAALTIRSLGASQSEIEVEESLAEVLNPLAPLIRASDTVARGNRKVFAEIGREFARFSAECLNDTTYDADKIARFCAELRPGDPPDGQQYLRQAFTRYYRAFFEADAKTRAELLLCANIEIGFHEQTRLQPEIAEAVEAAIVDPREFRDRLIRALFPKRGWQARLRLFLLRLFRRPSPFDALTESLLAEAKLRAHRVVTRYLMTIGLAGGARLRLGADVPAGFPASLQVLADADLLALLSRVDPTPDSPRDSGAVDWAELADRLHFIIDMFRCYQECADLFTPPFTPEQVADFRAGSLPNGRL